MLENELLSDVKTSNTYLHFEINCGLDIVRSNRCFSNQLNAIHCVCALVIPVVGNGAI